MIHATPRPFLYDGEAGHQALKRQIIRAVNSHDAMREALKEAYHELRIRCGYKDGDHCYETLKAALALAEKGA